MNSLKISTLMVGALLALGAAGACSSKVSQGGSETNWLCSTDADCTSGQTCVERKCETKRDGNTASLTADGGSAATQATTTFTDYIGWWTPSPCGANPDPECFTARCLPTALERDAAGNLPCSVMDVAVRNGEGCFRPGLSTPNAKQITPTLEFLRKSGHCDAAGAPACSDLLICALAEMSGTDLQSCLTDPALPAGAVGWCYIDPANDPDASSALVSKCPASQQRIIRASPPGLELRTLVIVCMDIRAGTTAATPSPGRIGDSCIPGDEYETTFSGFAGTEVNIETGTPQCETGLCLVANFDGRVSCPYGQPGDPANPNVVDPAQQTCFTPDGAPITVPVPHQRVQRPPSKAVYCSCRCDGPDPSQNYCACPSGFDCAPLVQDYGFGTTALPGSFCVKTGTLVTDPVGAECNPTILNCGPVRP